jgi:hypothetical protein
MRLISIHPLVKVGVMREEVSNGVLMARNVREGISEILWEGDPTGLMTGDLLRFMEILEVFMVSANFDGMLCAKEKQPSTSKAKNNGS